MSKLTSISRAKGIKELSKQVLQSTGQKEERASNIPLLRTALGRNLSQSSRLRTCVVRRQNELRDSMQSMVASLAKVDRPKIRNSRHASDCIQATQESSTFQRLLKDSIACCCIWQTRWIFLSHPHFRDRSSYRISCAYAVWNIPSWIVPCLSLRSLFQGLLSRKLSIWYHFPSHSWCNRWRALLG